MNPGWAVQFGHKGFWALGLTLFMVAYNVSVMPAIMASVVLDLDSNVGYIQEILVLFSLVTASFAPTTENLCRFFGRTRVFSVGLILYGIGIALTSLSPTIGILAISFSILTGLAATPLVSSPWALIDLIDDEKAEKIATLGLILASTLGGLSGSLLGGYLAFVFTWRWAFAPSLCLLIVVFLFRRSLPNQTNAIQQPIDLIGGMLSFLGLGAILTGFSLAGEFGWWEPKRIFSIRGIVVPPFPLSIVPVFVAVGVVMLGLFSYWQRRQAAQYGASLFRVGLLRKREFVLGLLTAMLHTMIVTGVQFNLYQYVPVAFSLNPYKTALTIIPYNVTMIVVLVAVLRYLSLANRIAPKYIVCSGILWLAMGLWVLYVSILPHIHPLRLMPGLILMGVGSGLFAAYITTLTYSVASLDEKPQAPGIYNPIQNLGSSLGRAVLGTSLVFFASQDIVDGVLQNLGKTLSPFQRNQAVATLQEMLQTLSRDELRETLTSKLPPSIEPVLRAINLDAATVGMRISLLIALLLAGICFLLAMTLPKYPFGQRSERQTVR